MTRKNVLIGLAGLVVGVALAYAAAGDIVTWTGKGSRRNTVEWKISSATVGSAADIVPGTDNTNSIGTSSYKVKDIQTYDATVSDDLTVSGDIAVSGNMTLPVVDITVTTPTATGVIAVTSAYVLYVSTATDSINDWIKVGGQ